LVIRVSRDPAENTSTSPLGRALAELDAELEEELDGELDAEVDEELLHPAAARLVQVMASSAATGAFFFAKTEIIHRTLPPIVALRK
jgi:hypothetical protein